MSLPRETDEFLASIGQEPERPQLQLVEPEPEPEPARPRKRPRMSRKALRKAEMERLADNTWVPIKDAPVFVWYKGRRSSPQVIAQSIRSLVMNLAIGTPERRVLEIVGRQYRKYEIGKAYLHAANVMATEGAGFKQALIAEEAFPRTARELLSASTTAQAVQENLKQAAKIISQGQSVKRRLAITMITPASTLVLCIVALFISATWIIPDIVAMFVQLNTETPPLTLGLLKAAEITKMVLGTLLTAGCGFGLYWMVAGRKSDLFKAIIDGTIIRIPHLGAIVQLTAVSRLFHLLATSLSAGISEPDALRSAASGCGNEAVKFHCLRHAEKMLYDGAPMKDFVNHRLIPEDATNQLTSAPSITQEIETMREISEEYREEANIRLDAFSETITPIVSVPIYLVAAALVCSLLIPLWEMLPALTELGDMY